VRARNLKPSLFTNELLAVSDPLYAWIFEGLWCAADREGRLEDRPAKLHMKINPGRAFEGTEKSLAWLAENKFISRYEVDGARYIQVLMFWKHQNPHHKEPASTIPIDPKAQGFYSSDGDKTQGNLPIECDTIPEKTWVNGYGSEFHGHKTLLIPDSGFLIPDSPSLIPDSHPPGLDRVAWTKWVEYRKAIKKPLKPVSIETAARKLASYGPDQAAMVEQSIANGWTGLFELKPGNAGVAKAPRRRARTAAEMEADGTIT
jgi:hypothetical protein